MIAGLTFTGVILRAAELRMAQVLKRPCQKSVICGLRIAWMRLRSN